jgi:hypothetical protein
MSELNENIVDQPSDGPRPNHLTPLEADANVRRETPLPPPRSNFRLWVSLGGGIFVLLVLVCGVVIMALSRARASAAQVQSGKNCQQMCLALNNITVCSTYGDIPPSYGDWLGNGDQSFFGSLLPYIEQGDLYRNQVTSTPVETYIAPADPNNPGNNGLISYGSNATLLTVGGKPRLPNSFGGRTSGVIVVFERTAASGATWSNDKSYLFDSKGSSSPEFQGARSWTGYETKATAFTSAGCVVGMGDGSTRVVTQSNAQTGWAWAMDPSISSNSVPNGW